MTIRVTVEELRRMGYDEDGNRIARTASNVEQNIGDELLGKKKAPRFTAPVRIAVCSTRGRLADTDGLSIKAVLDGIVKANILADDTPKEIKEIRFSQEKGRPEKTVITITEIK
ncbi:MAG TPA: hypothetical protein ENH82_07685 [bacterium]|nr:hypothetical protein [bacterium]